MSDTIERMKRAVEEAMDEMEWSEDEDGEVIDKDGNRVSAREFNDACMVAYWIGEIG